MGDINVLYREDMYAQDSIELLRRSGIDFKRQAEEGIDVNVFGELLMTSGIVLNEGITWLRFVLYRIGLRGCD